MDHKVRQRKTILPERLAQRTSDHETDDVHAAGFYWRTAQLECTSRDLVRPNSTFSPKMYQSSSSSDSESDSGSEDESEGGQKSESKEIRANVSKVCSFIIHCY